MRTLDNSIKLSVPSRIYPDLFILGFVLFLTVISVELDRSGR